MCQDRLLRASDLVEGPQISGNSGRVAALGRACSSVSPKLGTRQGTGVLPLEVNALLRYRASQERVGDGPEIWRNAHPRSWHLKRLTPSLRTRHYRPATCLRTDWPSMATGRSPPRAPISIDSCALQTDLLVGPWCCC